MFTCSRVARSRETELLVGGDHEDGSKSGVPACWFFMGFYGVCVVVTYVVYLRRAATATTSEQPRLAYARV
ncbi:MAG: hypothetical protein ACRDS0_32365 [Pseudonocardiaceae bacterium]